MKCYFNISFLLLSGNKNCSNISIPFYEAMSDFEINDGLIARMKNI